MQGKGSGLRRHRQPGSARMVAARRDPKSPRESADEALTGASARRSATRPPNSAVTNSIRFELTEGAARDSRCRSFGCPQYPVDRSPADAEATSNLDWTNPIGLQRMYLGGTSAGGRLSPLVLAFSLRTSDTLALPLKHEFSLESADSANDRE